MNTRTRGYTITELVVTLSIITIIAGLVPLSRDLIRQARVSSASKQLYADVQRLRVSAMTQKSRGFGIRFESPTAYTLFKFNDCNSDYLHDPDTCSGETKEEDIVMTRTLTSSLELNKTNPGTDIANEVLIFDRLGIPRTANWAFGWRTIIVKHSGDDDFMKCIVISTNRIREGLWGWDKRRRKMACVKH